MGKVNDNDKSFTRRYFNPSGLNAEREIKVPRGSYISGSPEAKQKVKTRRAIEDIHEQLKIKRDLEDY